MHKGKKETIYFCIMHISIVSVYKAATPVPHAQPKHMTLSYFAAALSVLEKLYSLPSLLWQLYGLLELCTA